MVAAPIVSSRPQSLTADIIQVVDQIGTFVYAKIPSSQSVIDNKVIFERLKEATLKLEQNLFFEAATSFITIATDLTGSSDAKNLLYRAKCQFSLMLLTPFSYAGCIHNKLQRGVFNDLESAYENVKNSKEEDKPDLYQDLKTGYLLFKEMYPNICSCRISECEKHLPPIEPLNEVPKEEPRRYFTTPRKDEPQKLPAPEPVGKVSKFKVLFWALAGLLAGVIGALFSRRPK